jgi:hypothetical protein
VGQASAYGIPYKFRWNKFPKERRTIPLASSAEPSMAVCYDRLRK